MLYTVLRAIDGESVAQLFQGFLEDDRFHTHDVTQTVLHGDKNPNAPKVFGFDPGGTK